MKNILINADGEASYIGKATASQKFVMFVFDGKSYKMLPVDETFLFRQHIEIKDERLQAQLQQLADDPEYEKQVNKKMNQEQTEGFEGMIASKIQALKEENHEDQLSKENLKKKILKEKKAAKIRKSGG